MKGEKFGICALCKKEAELKASHIIPKFVSRAVKKKSYTKKLRNAYEPDRAVQDIHKEYMLCGECEQRFSKRENLFNQKILLPYRNSERALDDVEYQEWLYYFITSVSWRSLYEDTKSKEVFIGNGFPESSFQALLDAESNMRKFLLGKAKKAGNIENHIFFLCESNDFNGRNIPYNLFSNCITGHLVGSKDGALHVFHILDGILIVTIIKNADKGRWKNTKVNLKGGKIHSTQLIKNSLLDEDINFTLRKFEEGRQKMSQSEKDKLIAKIQENPEEFMKSSSYKGMKI
ncbi:hypothetical protein BAOM_1403 [Peribacillus asahii]|uniref:HNH endonuclease n=1 Tax=Peribacillus asahii TaxID=228899 RepID=A0A3T0KP06_9BACI|nr:hypothetical protein [Peribacillus asahii]AZV42013.1 hypothetical protein BAOM_1403 [Peribacillus asahii]